MARILPLLITKRRLMMKTDKIKLIWRVVSRLNYSLRTLTTSIYYCIAEKFSGEDSCDCDDLTFVYSIKYADKNIIWLK